MLLKYRRFHLSLAAVLEISGAPLFFRLKRLQICQDVVPIHPRARCAPGTQTLDEVNNWKIGNSLFALGIERKWRENTPEKPRPRVRNWLISVPKRILWGSPDGTSGCRRRPESFSQWTAFTVLVDNKKGDIHLAAEWKSGTRQNGLGLL
ncbi:hypothetical protein CDAR_398571 [Caerostris darwini]|uniref:Uncharacterized protein n=1 Tax=Caerostris darwini TaxID=1538125 RepID=A0AAV4VE12_9ARAC|nr:hypothetical protein CDAR_398571 [Caerostris darwini]